MLGQAERQGKLNTEVGHSAEAVKPVYKAPLDQYGAGQWLRNTLAVPQAYSRAGRGIRATDAARTSDALMNVSGKPSEVNIYQMPTILVTYQLPPNKASAQDHRLPLNMVNPRLAWSPG